MNIAATIKLYFALVYSYLLIALNYAEIPHKAFFVLCILMVADITSGVIKGFVLKELSSRPIVNGMLRKTGLLLAIYFIFLGVSVIPEFAFLGNLALGMFIFAELISILGNIVAVREKQKVSEHDALVKIYNFTVATYEKMGKVK